MATWEDYSSPDSIERSKRGTENRNTGAQPVTETVYKSEADNSLNWTYVWAGTSIFLALALAVVVTLLLSRRKK